MVAIVPGGGLVNRVEGGVWQHQVRATLLVPLEALHNNIRTGDEVGSQM